MKENTASRTALGVALFRAIESTRPEQTRVCFDPLARFFLERPVRSAGTRRTIARLWHALLTHQGLGPAYGEVVVRTRYIDDLLERRISKDGVRQVVILGAGYDTRAFRLDDLKGFARFFELDHPATQEAKRLALARAGVREPDSMTFVPMDFAVDDLSEKLEESGYDETAETFFIWEGVTMYLEPAAIDETLKFVDERSASGSTIVFNYVIRATDAVGTVDRDVERMLERTKKWGEPIVFGLEKREVAGFLERRGLTLLENAECAQTGRAYFDAVGREQEIASHLAIAHARVTRA